MRAAPESQLVGFSRKSLRRKWLARRGQCKRGKGCYKLPWEITSQHAGTLGLHSHSMLCTRFYHATQYSRQPLQLRQAVMLSGHSDLSLYGDVSPWTIHLSRWARVNARRLPVQSSALRSQSQGQWTHQRLALVSVRSGISGAVVQKADFSRLPF